MSTKWQEIWARKYSPFIATSYFLTFLKSDPKWAACKNKLFVPKGNLNGYFFDEKELQAVIKKFQSFLLKQDIQIFAKAYENVFIQELNFCKKFSMQNFSVKSARELIADVGLLDKRLRRFGEWQLLSFIALEGPIQEVESKIKNKETLEAISTPYKETKVNLARLEFLKLCLKGNPTNEALQKYAYKYSWLPIYDFIDKPLDVSSLKKQVISPIKAQKEIYEYNFHKKTGLNNYKKIIKDTRDSKLKRLMKIAHVFSYLKEMRDDYRRPCYLILQSFFIEVGKRLNLDLKEVNYLLPEEIKSGLRHLPPQLKNLAHSRMNGYALELKNGKFKIHSGAKESIKLAEQTARSHNNELVSGTIGFKGVVTGTAKIIYHKDEFQKFKKGDILITAMTHPEFMPIMRIAKAIITDEGGLTCHAAIVAREMKKPCIIGTKIATKVFKDGDIVEVNANTGIVKLIKRK
ncbi:MAG: hypothetical protein HY918_02210 [Candidatus Doudnabacteria bacterium]|nr:hypothetical protein [Candidatus Doudnabacteria bacterium]